MTRPVRPTLNDSVTINAEHFPDFRLQTEHTSFHAENCLRERLISFLPRTTEFTKYEYVC